ncbi:MAG: M24 family metallopeptidase [Anaerolineales bacterium]
MSAEFSAKRNKILELLDRHGADGLLLRRVSSFAWATCGAASYVNTATTEGAASLLVTREHNYLATNNIEAPRLEQESGLAEQGWEFRVSPWTNPLLELDQLTAGLNFIADVPFGAAKDVSAEISRLRANLTPSEDERFRRLGLLCAQTMDSAAHAVQPGMSEYEIAALLGGEAQRRGVQPIVNLIASDERIYRFRHPLPTEKKLEKYALLVLSGRRWGLVCSISRLIHFGPIPVELQRRIHAAARVNAALIAHTRPGRSLEQVFQRGQAEYAAAAFPDEWRFHHQGGAVGYEPREFLGLPGSADVVSAGQAYAWNPTVAGAKMEDTILVGAHGNEIITNIPNWPVISIKIAEQNIEIECPLALEIN